MARSINEIKASIIAEKNAQADLAGLNSPSQTAIWNLWTYITAVAIWIHEVLWDKKQAEIEDLVSNRAVGTETWVQNKVFEFQYDAITPQVVDLDENFVPNYPVVDENLRIITRASVKTYPNKSVQVKVAKSEPPEALAGGELSSLQGYLDDISFAGVQYTVTSTAPDRLYADIDVYYNGQYSSVISANTVSAIESYMSAIPFDGQLRLSALVDAIQQVEGVSDIVLNNVSLRTAAQSFAGRTNLVTSNTTIYNKYQLFAGYVIEEDTSGYTFADSLTFIAES